MNATSLRSPLREPQAAFYLDSRGYAVCRECIRIGKRWRISINADETRQQNCQIARLHMDYNHVAVN
jgi:hypothetical protein